MMLHTKHQGSSPCDSRQEDFFMFSLYKSMQYDPGAGPILAQGDNLKEIGRDLLGDATYQPSRL